MSDTRLKVVSVINYPPDPRRERAVARIPLSQGSHRVVVTLG